MNAFRPSGWCFYYSLHIKPEEGGGKIVRLTIPLLIRRRHGRKGILSPEDANQSIPEVRERGLSALALHLARAYAWMEMIDSGKVASITELIKLLNIDKSYITRDLRLRSLAPDLQKLVIEGREPFPDDWEEQRQRFLATAAP